MNGVVDGRVAIDMLTDRKVRFKSRLLLRAPPSGRRGDGRRMGHLRPWSLDSPGGGPLGPDHPDMQVHLAIERSLQGGDIELAHLHHRLLGLLGAGPVGGSEQ